MDIVTSDTSAELRARYAPLFARIAENALERERDRVLPREQVALLQEAGFTALTVPTEFGGEGISLRTLFELLVDLGEADSNLPQILRAHFAVVEGLTARTDKAGLRWLAAAGRGEVFGNATHERSAATVGSFATTAAPDDAGGWRLNGTKAYSTGSLFADWVLVPATVDAETTVTLIVPADAEGVDLIDDWDGFGQRLTGSGTSIFTDVVLGPDAVFAPAGPPADSATHVTAFVELVLLATMVGVAEAALRDATEFVRTRTRVYSHGAGATAASDPLVQAVLGRLSAKVFAARASVLSAVDELQSASSAHAAGDAEAHRLIELAEIAAVRAQLAVIPLVQEITAQIFEVGGASATSTTRLLDRHWRNARTLASHNPAIYQERTIGDYLVNGTGPQYSWATGEAGTKRKDQP